MKNNQNKGFTVPEILIAVVLASLVMMVLLSMQNLFSKEQSKITNKAEMGTDTLLGERTLYIDMRAGTPSFNTLNVKDDRGNMFYDYYFDIPEAMLGNSPLDRVLTLEPGKDKVMYVISQDNLAGGLLDFDPVSAYKIGAIPANYNIAASLTYMSVNNNNWISSQRPLFWKDNKLLLFDTNVYVRPAGSFNMAAAPTMPAFIGRVSAASNQLVDSGAGFYMKSGYRSIDTFLRELQPRGGGMPFVKVRAVNFYRYYLQTYRDDRVVGTPARLIREEFVGGKFTQPLMMSDRVKSVKFSRESVMNKVIKFSIVKVELKNSKGGP